MFEVGPILSSVSHFVCRKVDAQDLHVMLQPVTDDDGGLVENVPDHRNDRINVRSIYQIFSTDATAKDQFVKLKIKFSHLITKIFT